MENGRKERLQTREKDDKREKRGVKGVGVRMYMVIRKGTDGLCEDFGGTHRTLKEAIWYAKELKRRHGGEWVVVKDGRTVWCDGMSYEDALRLCCVRG